MDQKTVQSGEILPLTVELCNFFFFFLFSFLKKKLFRLDFRAEQKMRLLFGLARLRAHHLVPVSSSPAPNADKAD